MSEAGGAGPGGGGAGAGLGALHPPPPAPPPAPPQGSPGAAAGGSGACGPATAVAAAGTAEGPGGGGSARIAVKKAQLRSAPRAKKLEKLGVYSACKVRARRPARPRGRGRARGTPSPSRPRLPPGAAAPRKCCCRPRPISCFSDQSAVGWEGGIAGTESLSFPLEGVASASELLGCPGALLLCRSSSEAPPREWSGAKATSFGGPECPPLPEPHWAELGGRSEAGIGFWTPGALGTRRGGLRGLGGAAPS